MLVFTAIMVFVLAGLTIRQAAIKATENAKKEVGASVTLSVDRDKMMRKAMSMANNDGSPLRIEETPVPLEQAEKVSKMKNVKDYSFSTSANAARFSSPVRILITLSTLYTKILPSPI